MLEERRHALAPCQIFPGGGATDRSHLKVVALADLRDRPRLGAINDKDGCARGKRRLQETGVRLSQPQTFETKISHAAEHEPVLRWVVHVMQLQISISHQQPLARCT